MRFTVLHLKSVQFIIAAKSTKISANVALFPISPNDVFQPGGTQLLACGLVYGYLNFIPSTWRF